VWQKESGFFLLGLEASNVEPPVEKVSESVVTLHPFPPSHANSGMVGEAVKHRVALRAPAILESFGHAQSVAKFRGVRSGCDR
jgi:hypothetical protein